MTNANLITERANYNSKLSAWTDLPDAIADWKDQVSARLNCVEPISDIEQEAKTCRCLCDAPTDFLEARAAA